MNRKFGYFAGEITETHENNDKRKSDAETTLVKEIVFANGRTIQYEYDDEERITKVVDSADGTFEYIYDVLGQLLTEKKNGTVVTTMTYDNYGNIRTKNGTVYTYDTTWKDKLTKVGTKSIVYDASGNPTNYLGTTLIWEKGRQLKKFGSYTYQYNKDGIRTQKIENGKTHDYVLDGTSIIKEIVNNGDASCQGYTNEYLYDIDGTECGLIHNGAAYYFYKNLQGDIISITDGTGTVKATYTYDAWGKCTVVSDTSGCNIANINPFRYRGYYYDAETKLYYLQSRYYDPEVGRFINADKVDNISPENTTATNLNTYCLNCPLMYTDSRGEEADYINNQNDSSWKKVAVGFWGNVCDNGCSAIAIYNVLHAYSKKATLKSVLRGLRWFYGSIIYNNIGVIGISPKSILAYLSVRFLFCCSAGPITYLWNLKSELCGAVVVLYVNANWNGLHYVAGIKGSDDKYNFYNCGYASPSESFTMTKYIKRLKENGVIPLLMIGVAKKFGWW